MHCECARQAFESNEISIVWADVSRRCLCPPGIPAQKPTSKCRSLPGLYTRNLMQSIVPLSQLSAYPFVCPPRRQSHSASLQLGPDLLKHRLEPVVNTISLRQIIRVRLPSSDQPGTFGRLLPLFCCLVEIAATFLEEPLDAPFIHVEPVLLAPFCLVSVKVFGQNGIAKIKDHEVGPKRIQRVQQAYVPRCLILVEYSDLVQLNERAEEPRKLKDRAGLNQH